MIKTELPEPIILTHQIASLWLYSIGCSSIVTWSFLEGGVASGLVAIGSAIAIPFIAAAAGRVMR